MRDQETFTEKHLWNGVSMQNLVKNLKATSPFGRGLPEDNEFSDPDITEVFLTLLLEKRIREKDLKSSQIAALLHCHRKGWVYSVKEGIDETFIFASRGIIC